MLQMNVDICSAYSILRAECLSCYVFTLYSSFLGLCWYFSHCTNMKKEVQSGVWGAYAGYNHYNRLGSLDKELAFPHLDVISIYSKWNYIKFSSRGSRKTEFKGMTKLTCKGNVRYPSIIINCRKKHEEVRKISHMKMVYL